MLVQVMVAHHLDLGTSSGSAPVLPVPAGVRLHKHRRTLGPKFDLRGGRRAQALIATTCWAIRASSR